MFGSRLTEESLTKDVSSTSNDERRRDATRMLENLLEHDPEYEDDSPFFNSFKNLLLSIGLMA